MVNFCKSPKCLIGKVAIITGANTGIGYETALDLAKRGCRVIMACRNEEKADVAREKIVQVTDNENVVVKSLDLASLESVRKFAQDIKENETRLDLLINNAGAVALPDTITPDGMQLEMQTNHFSPFLLTNLLLELLKKSSPSRIINVSSIAAKFYDLNLRRIDDFPGDIKLYCQSKLCVLLFTKILADKLKGTGVLVFSVHPGVVDSEFLRSYKTISKISGAFSINSKEGAQTTLYCALEEGLEEYHGEHFDDCKRVKPYCRAKNDKLAEQLWELSEQKVRLI